MKEKDNFPTHTDLMWPSLQAIKELGGSGSNEEIFDKLVEIQKYPESIQNMPHKSDKVKQTRLEYRAAWARSYLKMLGAIDNSKRGVWSITILGQNIKENEIKDLRKLSKKNSKNKTNKLDEDLILDKDLTIEDEKVFPNSWQDDLLEILYNIKPDEFEKLCQRILRESGFTKVNVTGKINDGGIDGVGVLKINLLSFQILFQCKRYKGSVGSSTVRDFRGAMVGRSDKGLIITTCSFTSEARKESTRDGAPTIELIDGVELCEIIKNLRLGIEVNIVEKININHDWFKNF